MSQLFSSLLVLPCSEELVAGAPYRVPADTDDEPRMAEMLEAWYDPQRRKRKAWVSLSNPHDCTTRAPSYGRRIGIRWTVGDVSARGFDALRLSILGARRIFGPDARYAVCVNSLPLETAQARVGEAATMVEWHLSDGRIPDFLQRRLGNGLAEGVAWKFAPLLLFPDRYEIALDNDCVLWALPRAIEQWLTQKDGPASCVLAEDMAPCFGWFAPLCGPEPRNTGIRGLPPGFDLETSLRNVLARLPDIRVAGEADEQGMQVAALSAVRPPLIVTREEVTICSPSPGHVQRLGTHGVHFVGLNMRHPRPEHGCDQTTLDSIAANWDGFREQIEKEVAGDR